MAKKVEMPVIIALDKVGNDEIINFLGARVKSLNTLGERSATGMDKTRGVLVVEVAIGSSAAKFLKSNDVILSFNYKQINNLRDLLEARMSVIGTNTEIIVFRNQKEEKRTIDLEDKK